jgi:hypothetical protein
LERGKRLTRQRNNLVPTLRVGMPSSTLCVAASLREATGPLIDDRPLILRLFPVFGHGHTLDIGVWVKPNDPIQGILLEKACTTQIDGERFGILRCIGITRPEMEYARLNGSARLLNHLKKKDVYPDTTLNRKSVVEAWSVRDRKLFPPPCPPPQNRGEGKTIARHVSR